jgi:outer membrane assembly lipoprotein YfiO
MNTRIIILLAVVSTTYSQEQVIKIDPVHVGQTETTVHSSKKSAKEVRARHSTSKNKRKTLIKKMNSDQLKELQQESVRKKNYSVAIKCLELRLKKTTEPEDVALILFELAEIQFDSGNLDTAIILYDDFKKRFAGHVHVEEAYYKSALAAYLTTLNSERDQTKTEKAIELADEYLQQTNTFTKYANEVVLMRSEEFQKLANHEFGICRFYKKRGNIKAVTKRLAHIEQKLLPELPALQTQLTAIRQEFGLQTDHPSDHTDVAPPTTITVAQTKKNMRDRF